MIRFEDITIRFDGRTVLHRASLALAPGEFGVLSGESGSGKSTLLRIAVGIEAPAEGRVFLGGDLMAPENLPAIRGKVAWVPQHVTSLPGETAREFIDAPFEFKRNRPLRPDRQEVIEALERLHLDARILGQAMEDLSGGERQRLALARVLLLRRPLLLLDEVTSAVDADNRSRILDALRGLDGVTCLAVTHDPRFTEAADRRFRLDRGAVVEEG
ncbi:MAG: ATP-binding cassette domain-containing protein [Pseudomonadota bacterium]